MILPDISPIQQAYFWSRVNIVELDCCWEWKFGRYSDGYGSVTYNRRSYLTHVIAFFLHTGVWPGEKLILHTCDNKICCNPNHLTDGSHQENNDDMLSKNRGIYPGNPCYGKWNSNTKLTESEVLRIRQLGIILKPGTIAKMEEFNGKVTKENIKRILKRQTWKHLP